MAGQRLLEIHMLGEFTIRRTDDPSRMITTRNSRSKKPWELLAYLLTFRDREIPQAELIELFWPSGEEGNPAASLKALIHRARGLLVELGLAGSLIVSSHGAYGIDSSLLALVDAERFDRLCRDSLAETDPAARLAMLREAADLFGGDFLEKFGGDAWVMPIGVAYHNQYLRVVRDLLDALKTGGSPEEIVRLCRRASAVDPYHETFQVVLLQAMAACGARDEALRHYAALKQTLMDQFGVSPSRELLDLYREISGGTASASANLETVCQDMKESSHTRAFYCEYAFFKDFYRVMLRSLARTGLSVNLVMLSVRDADGGVLSTRRTVTAMQKTHAVVADSLRRGDIFTQFSTSQYLLMLSSASYENSGMVMQRIVANFNRAYPGSKLTLRYNLMPLEQFEIK